MKLQEDKLEIWIKSINFIAFFFFYDEVTDFGKPFYYFCVFSLFSFVYFYPLKGFWLSIRIILDPQYIDNQQDIRRAVSFPAFIP